MTNSRSVGYEVRQRRTMQRSACMDKHTSTTPIPATGHIQVWSRSSPSQQSQHLKPKQLAPSWKLDNTREIKETASARVSIKDYINIELKGTTAKMVQFNLPCAGKMSPLSLWYPVQAFDHNLSGMSEHHHHRHPCVAGRIQS